MAVKEITVEQLFADEWGAAYDWASIFGEINEYNCSAQVESLDGVSDAPVYRKSVSEVIAAANGLNDGDEWVGLFLLKDGRYLVASGWCDYTGWD